MIEIEGELDPRRPSVRRRIGYAPQLVSLYPELTVRENLILLGRLYGLRGAMLKERVASALELARLTDRGEGRVGTFSGGMQRRLNLAAATVHSPSVLLLDEPTVGVDPQSRAHIFSCIEELKEKGISIVYSTHYLEEAQRLCDRIAIVDHGRVLATGTPTELLERYGGPAQVEAFMSEPPAAQALAECWKEGRFAMHTEHPTEVISALLGAGQGVTALNLKRPNLESVFMTLTGRSLRDDK